MTIKWWPTTICACELEYRTNNNSSVDPLSGLRIELYKWNLICPAHAVLVSDAARWTTLWDEMQRYSFGLQVCLDNGPTSLYDMSGTARILKPSITYNTTWSGTAPARILSISFVGVTLTNTQKNTIRSALNTRFGTNKVLLP